MNLAWPRAEIAVMGAEGAAKIVFRREIAAAKDPDAESKRLVADYKAKCNNPYKAAARGYVDDVIEPHRTLRRVHRMLAAMCEPSRWGVVLAVAALTPIVAAQVEWQQRDVLDAAGPVATDLLRGQLLMQTESATFAQTWLWNRVDWSRVRPSSSPPPVVGQALAYDAGRGVVVLFGGHQANGGWLDQTWEWNGVDWSRRTPAVSPPGRGSHAMAYDASRARVVMFGGETTSVINAVYLADTWEWDGTTWLQRNITGPARRSHHRVAFDAVRNRIVLFGGQWRDINVGAFTAFGDTWTFDGVAWTPAAGPSPPGRYAHGMTYDPARGKVVMFGGSNNVWGIPVPVDTWEWNGTWTAATPAISPEPRAYTTMAPDPALGGVLLVGGSGLRDVWRFDGAQWTRLAGTPPVPPAPQSAAAAFDSVRSRLVLFGGDGGSGSDHWEWDGVGWTELTFAVTPQARYRSAMAFDARRGRCVLFSGASIGPSGSLLLADTWEYDGTSWSQSSVSVAPAARIGHTMVFDSARNGVLLFGGSGGIYFGDTWWWDGQSWTQLATTGPSPRNFHGMAFDSTRGVAVVFGGASYYFGTLLADTWEWNGTACTSCPTAVAPAPRAEFSMAFDSARRRTVLFGGGYFPHNDTWDWDGITWTQRLPVTAPPARSRHVLVYDSGRARTLLFGGNGSIQNLSDLWEYGAVVPATVAAYGAGCAGTAGTPALGVDNAQLPWLGDSLVLALDAVPSPGFAMFWIGGSRSISGSFSLPLDLTSLGMPGCTLLAEVAITALAPVVSGRATLNAIVPVDPALVGVAFYAQAAGKDAGANAFGFVLSQGLALQVGSR